LAPTPLMATHRPFTQATEQNRPEARVVLTDFWEGTIEFPLFKGVTVLSGGRRVKISCQTDHRKVIFGFSNRLLGYCLGSFIKGAFDHGGWIDLAANFDLDRLTGLGQRWGHIGEGDRLPQGRR
jgi:hypothetical protein